MSGDSGLNKGLGPVREEIRVCPSGKECPGVRSEAALTHSVYLSLTELT